MTRALWLEMLAVCAGAAAFAAAVPLYAGTWAWSWDALNHHVYLGYIAENPRWHLDVVAASVQSFQYPYLYWPVYRLSLLPIPGSQTGAIWGAILAILLTAPLWVASKRLLSAGAGVWQARFDRVMACALALSGIVVMAALNTTANDPLATVPLLWAIAIMAVPSPSSRRAGLASALWGAATAFKLSNGLALPLLLLWWWAPGLPGWWWRRAVAIAAGASLGYAVAYAPWGWQLWREFGNPFYPLFGWLFAG